MKYLKKKEVPAKKLLLMRLVKKVLVQVMLDQERLLVQVMLDQVMLVQEMLLLINQATTTLCQK